MKFTKLHLTKGYRLHAKRYQYHSGLTGNAATGIRTMKYQLDVPDALKAYLGEMIKHDYRYALKIINVTQVT